MLVALPAPTWERLAPHLRPVLLHQGTTLYEPGKVASRCHFINAGMISLVLDTRDGAQVEVGIVAREGMVDAVSLLSQQPPLHRAIVQIAGTALSIPTDILRGEYDNDKDLRAVVHRHVHLLTVQTAQCALCNRLHSVDSRLCRWLATVAERTGASELNLTHEFLGHMLGTRRVGITIALGDLEKAGLINTGRQCIEILDMPALRKLSCECYGVIGDEFTRVYGDTHAWAV